MRQLGSHGLQFRRGPAFLVLVLGYAFAGSASLAAQEDPALHASPTQPQIVLLDYREVTNSLINWPIAINPQTKPFRIEPDLKGGKVRRGELRLGNQGEQAMPFLWDYTQGKLYLDLNRNGNLTDDPAGVFSSPRPRFSTYYQIFTNVHLTLETPAGKRSLLLDLTLYNPNNNQFGGSAASRSFWEGKIALQGQEWQIGVIENLPNRSGPVQAAYLLLRPWPARDQAFDTQSGCLDAFTFCLNLFFGQQAYGVECAFDQQDGAPKYKITLREKEVELGDLKLTGKSIQRLVLTGNSAKSPNDRFTVVLDTPEAAVRIPTGTYGPCQMQLKAGAVDAYREAARFGPAQAVLTIVANSPKAPILNAGGPLTNTVSVGRRGAFLSLSYQLVGADGAPYQLAHLDRSQPPRFNIYKNGKLLESGKFEFG